MKKSKLLLFAATLLLLFSSIATGQGRIGRRAVQKIPSQNTVGRVEPLRALGGIMHGRVITGQTASAGRPIKFSLSINSIDLKEGKLQLHGTFDLGAGRSRSPSEVSATFAGSTARFTNPWASARTAPLSDPATHIVSLYPSAEPGTGCELIFLRLTLPQRLRRDLGAGADQVQLGVVLAPLDNQAGQAINNQICRIVATIENNSGESAQSLRLQELNKMLSSGQK